ncbi:MAG: hypothetical protein GF398_17185 [Chitinivibrionales bacterium]|nr:hypothetical protein [Chitinivibrionales bacterium]
MSIITDRIKAMRYDYPEYIPVSIEVTAACWIKYGEKLHPILDRHPWFFCERSYKDYEALRLRPMHYERTDAWGCVWKHALAG